MTVITRFCWPDARRHFELVFGSSPPVLSSPAPVACFDLENFIVLSILQKTVFDFVYLYFHGTNDDMKIFKKNTVSINIHFFF